MQALYVSQPYQMGATELRRFAIATPRCYNSLAVSEILVSLYVQFL